MSRADIWVYKPRRDKIPFLARASVPTWLVDVLAPGIDYYTVAGFPTWQEAMDYANDLALRRHIKQLQKTWRDETL